MNDNYKLAFRRMIKLVSIFTDIVIIKDDVFNVAEDLSVENLKVLETKIKNRLLRKKNFNLYIDLLYIYAELIISVKDNTKIVRPSLGLPINKYSKVLGLKTRKNLFSGDRLNILDLERK